MSGLAQTMEGFPDPTWVLISAAIILLGIMLAIGYVLWKWSRHRARKRQSRQGPGFPIKPAELN